MPAERCQECGFDSTRFSDAAAIDAAEGMAALWSSAIDGLSVEAMARRPIAGMWSIAEYTDHVRETAFGMRFLIDVAVGGGDVDLGDAPPARFDPEPRRIDAHVALDGFKTELAEVCARLRSVAPEEWESSCVVGGERIDIHWIARHLVHDVSHHINDVKRLRSSLS